VDLAFDSTGYTNTWAALQLSVYELDGATVALMKVQFQKTVDGPVFHGLILVDVETKLPVPTRAWQIVNGAIQRPRGGALGSSLVLHLRRRT